MPPPYEIGKTQTIRQFSLNYKHIFSMEYLYKMLHEWLLEEGYNGESDMGRSDNWMERLYLERMQTPTAKQIWIWWRPYKEWSKLVKFQLNVDFHGLYVQPHELVVNGTKVKTNKGEIEVFITARMTVDPKKEWNDHFFLKNKYIQNFYLNRIYKKRLEMAENQLIKDSARMLGAVKQYMQLESWLPEYTGKAFRPEKGIEGSTE